MYDKALSSGRRFGFIGMGTLAFEIMIGSIPDMFLIPEDNSLNQRLVRVSLWSGLPKLRQ